MRFAGIRKFSGSGPAGVRSLGVRCRERVQNGNNSIIEALSGLKKTQTAYIKRKFLKPDNKGSRSSLPIFSTVVSQRSRFDV
jgi:hypothetical protein